MSAHNTHWFQTHDRLQTIAYELLKTITPTSLTVSHICQQANINRSTFYAHFQDVPALLEETQRNKRQALIQSFIAQSQQAQLTFFDLTSVTAFLTFIKQNGWFYQIILRTRTDFPIQEGFDQLYARLMQPTHKNHPDLSDDELLYLFVAFQAGFTLILRRWAEANYQTPIDVVGKIIIDALPHLIFESLFTT